MLPLRKLSFSNDGMSLPPCDKRLGRLCVVVGIDKKAPGRNHNMLYAAKPVAVGQRFLAGRDVERVGPEVGSAGQFAG